MARAVLLCFIAYTCCAVETASSQKSAATSEPDPLPTEDDPAMVQCPEKYYWIVTQASGERKATRCCDQEEINIDNATVCVMTDPVSAQVCSCMRCRSAVTTSVSGWRTFPDLHLIYS